MITLSGEVATIFVMVAEAQTRSTQAVKNNTSKRHIPVGNQRGCLFTPTNLKYLKFHLTAASQKVGWFCGMSVVPP